MSRRFRLDGTIRRPGPVPTLGDIGIQNRHRRLSPGCYVPNRVLLLERLLYLIPASRFWNEYCNRGVHQQHFRRSIWGLAFRCRIRDQENKTLPLVTVHSSTSLHARGWPDDLLS